MLKNIMPKLFNRKAEKSNPEIIFDVLGDLKGKTIGDVGSGGGFFSLLFAEAVGVTGKVFAIDNNRNNLEFVKQLSERKGYKNIEIIYSKDNEIPLEEEVVDLFFSRNSFHHIHEPDKYFNKPRIHLKPKGKVVIIDHKKTSKFNFVNLFGHYSSESDIKNALEKAGYKHLSSHNILKNQSFNIFEKI